MDMEMMRRCWVATVLIGEMQKDRWRTQDDV